MQVDPVSPKRVEELQALSSRQSEELAILRRVCAHQSRAISMLGTESLVDFWVAFCGLTGFTPEYLGNMTPAEALRQAVAMHAAKAAQ